MKRGAVAWGARLGFGLSLMACGGGGASSSPPMAANASPREVAACKHMGQIRSEPPSGMIGQPDRASLLRQRAYSQGATHVVMEDDAADTTFNGVKRGQMYKCEPGQAADSSSAPTDAGTD